MLKDIARQNIGPLNYSDCIPAPTFSYFAGFGGNIGIFEWMQENNYAIHGQQAIEGAAAAGRLETMKWLVERYSNLNDLGLRKAIRRGHVDCVKYIVDKLEYVPVKYRDLAIKYGQLELLKYLVDVREAEVNPSLIAEVARRGYVNILDWLMNEKHVEADRSYLIHCVGFSGRLEMHQWLYERGIKCDVPVLAGSLECLEFLEKNNIQCEYLSSVFYGAEKYDLPLLKRLRGFINDDEWISLVNSLDYWPFTPKYLEFLLDNGMTLTQEHLQSASIHVLSWLYHVGAIGVGTGSPSGDFQEQ